MSPSLDDELQVHDTRNSLLAHAQRSSTPVPLRDLRPNSSSGSNQRYGLASYLGRISSRRIPLLLLCVSGLTLVTLFTSGSDSENPFPSVASLVGSATSRPLLALDTPLDTLPHNSGHSEPFAPHRLGEINLPEYPLLNYSAGVARVAPLPEDVSDPEVDTHPIAELIARGRRTAAEHEARKKAVDSLEKAVQDYERAFGMSPPEGFERW
jgi:hypothetical protein